MRPILIVLLLAGFCGAQEFYGEPQPTPAKPLDLPFLETKTQDFSYQGEGELIEHLKDHPLMENEVFQLHEYLHQKAEKLRPAGAYSFIIVEADEQAYIQWAHREAIQKAGWVIVRQPLRTRVKNLVVIGQTHFSHAGFLTVQALQKFVNQAENRKTPPVKNRRAKYVTKITMYTRAGCSFCDQWKNNERPKAVAEGVQVDEVTDLTRSVPRFEVCDSEGVCRQYVGFTSFQSMKAAVQ